MTWRDELELKAEMRQMASKTDGELLARRAMLADQREAWKRGYETAKADSENDGWRAFFFGLACRAVAAVLVVWSFVKL